MPSILNSLKLLADPTRLRVVLLLAEESLSVAELQEILGMGQSRISTQLAQLKKASLVSVQRSGKNNIYSAKPEKELLGIGKTRKKGNIKRVKRPWGNLALPAHTQTFSGYFPDCPGHLISYISGTFP